MNGDSPIILDLDMGNILTDQHILIEVEGFDGFGCMHRESIPFVLSPNSQIPEIRLESEEVCSDQYVISQIFADSWSISYDEGIIVTLGEESGLVPAFETSMNLVHQFVNNTNGPLNVYYTAVNNCSGTPVVQTVLVRPNTSTLFEDLTYQLCPEDNLISINSYAGLSEEYETMLVAVQLPSGAYLDRSEAIALGYYLPEGDYAGHFVPQEQGNYHLLIELSEEGPCTSNIELGFEFGYDEVAWEIVKDFCNNAGGLVQMTQMPFQLQFIGVDVVEGLEHLFGPELQNQNIWTAGFENTTDQILEATFHFAGVDNFGCSQNIEIPVSVYPEIDISPLSYTIDSGDELFIEIPEYLAEYQYSINESDIADLTVIGSLQGNVLNGEPIPIELYNESSSSVDFDVVVSNTSDFDCMFSFRINIEVLSNNNDDGGGIGRVESEEITVEERENYKLSEVLIHPNPFMDKLFLNIGASKPSRLFIDLINSSNQKIESFERRIQYGKNSIQLDINNIGPGVYILKYRSDDGILAGRKKVICIK